MTPNGTLVGHRWGPNSAIRPQPRGRRAVEVANGVPTGPWGSRRLPRTLRAGDGRRTLFRTLLRHAEGVPIRFPDGEAGVVDGVAFRGLGYDFWPEALLVRFPQRRRHGVANRPLRVPVSRVRRIDVREPGILVDDDPSPVHTPAPARRRTGRGVHRLPASR